MSISPPIMAAGLLLDAIGSLFEAINNLIMVVIKELLKLLERLITQTPYPKGEDDVVKLMGEPTNTGFVEAYGTYHTSLDLAIFLLFILLVIGGVLAIYDSVLPSYNSSDTINKAIKAMLISAFWWPVGAAMLAFSDLLAESVVSVYSASEDGEYVREAAEGESRQYALVNAFENIKSEASIGEGDGSGAQGIAFNIALIIPFIIQVSLLITLLVLWIIRYLVIFIVMPIMPLAFALWAFDFPGFEFFSGIGEKIIKGFISLVFLSFPAAVIITVFSIYSEDLLGLLNDIGADGSSTGSMALADGVAATGDMASVGATLAAAFMGVILIIVLPLIVAGGPFYLLNQSRDMNVNMKGIKQGGAMSTLKSGAAPGMMGSAGQKIAKGGSTAGGFARDMHSTYTADQSSGSSGSSGSTNASSEPENELDEETGESSPSSRYGKMRQKMSSGFETAKKIHDESAGKTAGRLGRRTASAGATASSLMASKSKSTGMAMESSIHAVQNRGAKGAASVAKRAAANKTMNAASKARLKAEDTADKVKQVPEKVDRNYSKNVARVKQAKKRSDKRRREQGEMSDKALAQEMSGRRKTADQRRRERADAGKKNKKEKEREKYLKAIGKWDEFKNSDKSLRQVVRHADGQALKGYEMPDSVARELGLDPGQNIEDQFAQDTYSVSPKTREEMIEHSDEFDDFEDVKEAAKMEGMTTGDFVRQKRAEMDIEVERKSIDAPDKQQVNTREDAREKYGGQELLEMSKKAGYGENVGTFIDEEMIGNERKRDRKDNSKDNTARRQDAMSQVFDDVEGIDESVASEELIDKAVEANRAAKKEEKDIDRGTMTADVINEGSGNVEENLTQEESAIRSGLNMADEQTRQTRQTEQEPPKAKPTRQ